MQQTEREKYHLEQQPAHKKYDLEQQPAHKKIHKESIVLRSEFSCISILIGVYNNNGFLNQGKKHFSIKVNGGDNYICIIFKSR
jgi:hypothetical protein